MNVIADHKKDKDITKTLELNRVASENLSSLINYWNIIGDGAKKRAEGVFHSHVKKLYSLKNPFAKTLADNLCCMYETFKIRDQYREK